VRDLLHRQVDLQHTRATLSSEDFAADHASLDADWDALIAREHLHRTEPMSSTGRRIAAVLKG
jgi:anaerobic magnesium-protoporphyrin IX monomethyl ester cyclase